MSAIKRNLCHGSVKGSFWLAIGFAFAALASACAPTGLYQWGHYEQGLKASYVTHDQAEARTALEAAITSAQKEGPRVPPGVCAELGFLLYKRGQSEQAIEYFQKEAQLYPESKLLMDKPTAKVREQASAQVQPAPGGGTAQ
jgi:hypothetical protein